MLNPENQHSRWQDNLIFEPCLPGVSEVKSLLHRIETFLRMLLKRGAGIVFIHKDSSQRQVVPIPPEDLATQGLRLREPTNRPVVAVQSTYLVVEVERTKQGSHWMMHGRNHRLRTVGNSLVREVYFARQSAAIFVSIFLIYRFNDSSDVFLMFARKTTSVLTDLYTLSKHCHPTAMES